MQPCCLSSSTPNTFSLRNLTPDPMISHAQPSQIWSGVTAWCIAALIWQSKGKSEIDRMTAFFFIFFFIKATIKRFTLILNLSQVVSSLRTCWELSQCQLEQWQKWLSHLTVTESPATSQSVFCWCLLTTCIRHHQVSPVHVFRGHNFTTRWFCFARLSLHNKQALCTCSVASSTAGTEHVLRKQG